MEKIASGARVRRDICHSMRGADERGACANPVEILRRRAPILRSPLLYARHITRHVAQLLAQSRRQRPRAIPEARLVGGMERETDSTTGDSPRTAKKALYKSFVPEILLRKVWRYAARKTPYMVNYRGKKVTTRPKINYSTMKKDGDYEVWSCSAGGRTRTIGP